MRIVDVPVCPICSSGGRVLYEQLRDHWFNAPGQWRMRQCTASSCGALWLDPAPHPDALSEAYVGYHTHADADEAPRHGTLRDNLYQSFAALRLGYPPPAHRAWRLLGAMVTAWPKRADIARATCMYLPYVKDGRALDVGCGAGRQLAQLADRGWTVMGIEPDAAAAQVARAKGFVVQLGDLTTVDLPAASLDAIVMSHVIEHLPEPRKHLLRARTLLRPGGRLAIFTPNAASLGHRAYRHDWRGLEPPRHLQVFTPPALHSALTGAGFEIEHLGTSARNAAASFAESARLEPGAKTGLAHCALESIERIAVLAGAAAGDELVAVGRSPRPD